MRKAFLAILFFLAILSISVFAEAQPWDALRPFNLLAESLHGITTWIVLLLSALLMILSVLAYQKKKNKRYFFIALAFVFFFVKWLLAAVDLYYSPGIFFNWAGGTLVELVIFACLFIALFKRQ